MRRTLSLLILFAWLFGLAAAHPDVQQMSTCEPGMEMEHVPSSDSSQERSCDASMAAGGCGPVQALQGEMPGTLQAHHSERPCVRIAGDEEVHSWRGEPPLRPPIVLS